MLWLGCQNLVHTIHQFGGNATKGQSVTRSRVGAAKHAATATASPAASPRHYWASTVVCAKTSA